MPEEAKEVVETNPGTGAEPTTASTEEVTSPEVKVEQPTSVVENEETAKMQDQINNLNIALKQERDSKKTDNEKVKALEEKLEESQETITKLRDVFSPEQPVVEDEPKVGFTQEQLEDFWRQKEDEREAKSKEQKQAEMIRSEITEMETAWNGQDGKPKYDDAEVIEWQKANGKLHLTPKAAFYEKHHSDIVDYEVKQRLVKKPTVENVEQPGAMPAGREPQVTKPKTELETRQAVLEAMDTVVADNNT